MRFTAALALILIAAPLATLAQTIDFFYLPDSASGGLGDTVLLSAQMGPSDTVRSFTIYIYNDTNIVDLAAPPTPGALIAGRPGLDFRYLDHVPVAPHRLEIGATVFSTAYWAGPGELFRMRLTLRTCTDYTLTASGGFRRPDATYIPANYHPPVILICDRLPVPPSYLTIHASPEDSVTLYWSAARWDTLGRPLLHPPVYRIYREQLQPVPIPPQQIGLTQDTSFVDAFTGTAGLYYVRTEVLP